VKLAPLRGKGRKADLNPELEARVAQLLKAGNYFETTAVLVGKSKVTLYSWIRRGRKERRRLEADPRAKERRSEAPFLAFLNAVETAQAHAEVVDVAAISAGSRVSWQAAAWRLERKLPERWGRRSHPKVALQREVDSFITEIKAALDPSTFQVVADTVARICSACDAGSGYSDPLHSPEIEPEGTSLFRIPE
jgi:hypothetical protein